MVDTREAEERTLQVIRQALEGARKPIVGWSGGKDAMALLDLCRSIHQDVACLWLRLPQKLERARGEFPLRVIRDWGLTVYDYPPWRVTPLKVGEDLEVVADFAVGPAASSRISVYLTASPDPQQCFFDLIPEAPYTPRSYPWDVTFFGQRESDSHPEFGQARLLRDGTTLGATKVYYPLRHWTDEEVWSYTEEHQLPVNRKRYEEGSAAHDPDRVACCTRCFYPDAVEKTCYCPKFRQEIVRVRADWEGLRQERAKELGGVDA